MGTIAVSLPADGTTAEVADYNTPITTIVDEINGGLDNANIATGAAIAGSKLADASVTPAKRSGGFAIGTFTKTTTGSVTVTGLSFQPKLIKLSLMISATTGSFFIAEGAADGTSQYSYGAAGTTAPGMSRWSVTTACMNVRNVSGTSIVVASFTSFNSDGFTLDFTTADAAAGTFAYEAYA